MSEGIAPAVDKVGKLEPTAAEAQAGAPSIETAKPVVPVPAEKPAEEEDSAPTEASKAVDEEPSDKKTHDGPILNKKFPKPVEVQSVPETPVNASTPVNGTPRPELNIPMETDVAEPEKTEAEPVITGVQEPLPTPTASVGSNDEPVTEIIMEKKPGTQNGDEKSAETVGSLQTEQSDARSESTETGAKRKLESPPADEEMKDGDSQGSDDAEPADKKVKVDATGTEVNGGATGKGKPGRPKKDKTAVPIIGRTARKTRSQGPAETTIAI